MSQCIKSHFSCSRQIICGQTINARCKLALRKLTQMQELDGELGAAKALALATGTRKRLAALGYLPMGVFKLPVQVGHCQLPLSA